MSKDARFWRNVTLIALAHVALLLGLIRWSVEARSSSNAQSIVWLSGAENVAAEERESGESPQPVKISTPPPEPSPLPPEDSENEQPLSTTAKSEIELPPTTLTPKVREAPKPTPKKTVLAKASPKPSPKAKASPTKFAKKAEEADANAEKKKIAKTAPAKGGSASQDGTGKTSSAGKGGHAGGGSSASEFAWYGNMLHDRFYSAWIQPTTTVASGTKISTLVKVRIEKDGRVSKFEIIKPSENVIVNESVATIAKRVTQVDPPPAGLGNGDHYDVNINVELNSEQAVAK